MFQTFFVLLPISYSNRVNLAFTLFFDCFMRHSLTTCFGYDINLRLHICRRFGTVRRNCCNEWFNPDNVRLTKTDFTRQLKSSIKQESPFLSINCIDI